MLKPLHLCADSILQTPRLPRKVLGYFTTRKTRAGRVETLVLLSLGSRLVQDLLSGSNLTTSDTLELAVVLD